MKNKIAKFVLDIIVWFILWFFLAWFFKLVFPEYPFTQGAWTAAFTIFIHRLIFP